MYGSSMIGAQWKAAIVQIDEKLKEQLELDPDFYYDGDFSDLLEQRKRLDDALHHSGEVPTVTV